MEAENTAARSDNWIIIRDIIKQIPRKDVVGDAMDANSAATEIEHALFSQLYGAKPYELPTEEMIVDAINVNVWIHEDGVEQTKAYHEQADILKAAKAITNLLNKNQ